VDTETEDGSITYIDTESQAHKSPIEETAMFKRFLNRLVEIRDSLDDALIVSALAQAGEPELARIHVRAARRNREGHGTIELGEACRRAEALRKAG
jgi:hypothetical protein